MDETKLKEFDNSNDVGYIQQDKKSEISPRRVVKPIGNQRVSPTQVDKRAKDYPADTIDNWLELYKQFKLKCWRHGITDKEEIVLLFKIA